MGNVRYARRELEDGIRVRLCFLDTETTGLDPTRHEIWEIAMVVVGPDSEDFTAVWQPDVDLTSADEGALKIGDFAGRYTGHESPIQVAKDVVIWTDGAIIVGANPHFDLSFLTPFLRAWGSVPNWHYSPVDVKSLAAGKLGITPPWGTDDLIRHLEIDYPEDRHSALGDALLAKRIYEQVLDKNV